MTLGEIAEDKVLTDKDKNFLLGLFLRKNGVTSKLRSRKVSRFSRKYEKPPHTLKELMGNPKPMLTKRDKELLMSLYYHRCLTSHQVAKMHFRYRFDGSLAKDNTMRDQASRRLRMLYDYHIVDRYFVDMPVFGN